MATGFLTRSLLTTRQTLSTVFSRSYTSLSLSTPPSPISSLSSFSIIRLRPLVAVAPNLRNLSPTSTTLRGFSTRRTSNSLNDPNPNWSNRPPKETILLDGCDFEHWLVVLEKPEGDPTRDEIIDSYIKTLAMVVGSEEEARMKIYSVSTRCYYAFGALVSEEVSYKIKELPKVRWVLPDSYLDVRNKDYGGEPFINGQAVPYDPKYHEEWVRNNSRANERNRRNDRPRNHDRSRNFERRRENTMQNRELQNPVSNMAGTPPYNVGGPPPNNMGPQSNMGGVQHNSMGGPPNVGGRLSNNMGNPPNMGGMPPQNNMGGVPNNAPNMGGPPPPYVGGGPPNNMSGMSPNQMGGVPNNASNYQYRNGPNNGGGMPYQSGPGPNREQQNSYAPPNMAGGNPYQTQDMPGRDMPPPSNYQ